MKKMILSIIASAGLAGQAFAGGFGLETIKASDLRGSQDEAPAVPAAQMVLLGSDRSPNLAAPVLDMTIKLPFKDLSSRLASLPLIKLQPIDANSPMLFKEGDHISLSNVTVDYNGIEVEPTIQIKPV
ncbi:MAG: hypothetical protein M0025_11865, partial [Elusimicrobia bacterium]|nr:hypothetical protein [Elusimicrobiota bacterium]